MKLENIILTDTHVHVHDCFDMELLLNSSYVNFRKYAESFNAENFEGILCLTENFTVNYFDNLKQNAINGENYPGLQIHLTDESNSLSISNANNNVLYLIAGRQIVTKERLEVLGIGVNNSIMDGKPLEETVELVNYNKGLPVIPWGVGKWTGERKKIISNLISKYKGKLLFIGDNGNRPFFWGKSSVFLQAEKLNIHNLPGTDPLPFKTENKRAGSHGFILEGKLDSRKPFESLKEKILSSNAPLLYGKPEKTLRFIRNQFLMNFVKQRKIRLGQ